MSASADRILTMASNKSQREQDGLGQARLRSIEAILLAVPASNIGKPMSREELCRQVWKCEFRGTTRSINQTVATCARSFQHRSSL